MEKTMVETLYELAKLGKEKQAAFFDSLSDVITDDEKRALLVGVAYFRMIMFPDLQKAMKQSLSAVLYTEFNKKEV